MDPQLVKFSNTVYCTGVLGDLYKSEIMVGVIDVRMVDINIVYPCALSTYLFTYLSRHLSIYVTYLFPIFFSP